MRTLRTALWLGFLAVTACQNVSGPTHQFLVASVSSTGSSIDLSYLVRVDTASGLVLIPGSSDSVPVDAGRHLVKLDDVAANCVVIGANPVTVTVAADAVKDLAFSVVCSGNPPPPPPPPSGQATLRVSASTPGLFAPAEYGVRATDPWTYVSRSASVPSNGTVSLSIPSGGYTVTLSVPANCIVTNGRSRSVSLVAGQVTSVAFSVTCAAPATLSVMTSTTGSNVPPTFTVGVDPDSYYGYGYSFNAPSSGTAATALPAGSHRVKLLVPLNCTVTSANNVTVVLSTGSTTNLGFAVSCS